MRKVALQKSCSCSRSQADLPQQVEHGDMSKCREYLILPWSVEMQAGSICRRVKSLKIVITASQTANILRR